MGDLDLNTYEILRNKSKSLDISVGKLCQIYGLNTNANMNTTRLSKRKVKEIPYLTEMQARKKELMDVRVKKFGDPTKEERFEILVGVAQQVYKEFSQKIENYIDVNETFDNEETVAK